MPFDFTLFTHVQLHIICVSTTVLSHHSDQQSIIHFKTQYAHGLITIKQHPENASCMPNVNTLTVSKSQTANTGRENSYPHQTKQTHSLRVAHTPTVCESHNKNGRHSDDSHSSAKLNKIMLVLSLKSHRAYCA